MTQMNKLLAEPQVFLVGKSVLIKAGLREFLKSEHTLHWTTDAPDGVSALSEIAGRVCYMSFGRSRPGDNETYLERIIESLHGSVLEHTVFNFIITGISRGLSHELVRHRVGVAYSQLSTRYVDESDACFVVPPLVSELGVELQDIFIEHYRNCRELYTDLVEAIMGGLEVRFPDQYGADDQDTKTALRKAARGAARAVLPIGLETKMFFSVNCRALRHILEMRMSSAAETEIRIVAGMIFDIVRKEAPAIFADYSKKRLPDGTYEIVVKNRKV